LRLLLEAADLTADVVKLRVLASTVLASMHQDTAVVGRRGRRQAACAVKLNADWIVTRNIGDFRKSPVAARPPGAVLAAIRASGG
jgi:hypothetical protein